MGTVKNILCIGDLHCPFNHKDSIHFLKAVCNEMIPNPDVVVFMGDEIDGNSFSFHDKDPDAIFTPSTELDAAIEQLAPFYELFPKAKILESNHGALFYRKAKIAMIPKRIIKPYADILDAPVGWEWVPDLRVDGERTTYFNHGIRQNGFRLAEVEGMNIVQGHFHTTQEAIYKIHHNRPLFSMATGCLVDQRTYAFEYAKNFRPNFRLGCGIIINGRPQIIQMTLKTNGRWDGKIR